MKKPMMFGGVAAVVLLALVWFFVLPMMKGKPAEAVHEEDEEEVHATATAKKKPRRVPEPGLFYPVSDRVVNLAGPPGVRNYARIELSFEFEPPADAKGHAKKDAGGGGHGAPASAEPALDPALEPVAARKVQIDDAVLRIISSKTAEEITSAEGKEALKAELMEAVDTLLGGKPSIIGVYIVRLVVQ